MSHLIKLQAELRQLLDEQSESLKRQTFLGLARTELHKEEQRMRQIRYLFADLLSQLHDNSLSSDMLHPAQRSSLSGGAMDEKAGVTLPGTVEKIIPPVTQGGAEKAQISVEGGDPLYEEIRIENSLQSPNGNEVRLKVGAEVDVTIEAPEKSVNKGDAPSGEPEN